MTDLELKVPPDAVWLLVAALMWLASAIVPGLVIPVQLRVGLAMALVGVGVGAIIGARLVLDRSHTTWHPTAPRRTSSLVTAGPYRVSRNPMYLGMLLMLVGLAVVLASPLALVLSSTFVLYMDRFQIGPEERALSEVLGQPYDDYAHRVRRWL